MHEVLESRIHAPAAHSLRRGVACPARARGAPGDLGGVGYRLRQGANLIQTGKAFAWTLTLVIMMAIPETGILRPIENHLFRWIKEAEQ